VTGDEGVGTRVLGRRRWDESVGTKALGRGRDGITPLRCYGQCLHALAQYAYCSYSARSPSWAKSESTGSEAFSDGNACKSEGNKGLITPSRRRIRPIISRQMPKPTINTSDEYVCAMCDKPRAVIQTPTTRMIKPLKTKRSILRRMTRFKTASCRARLPLFSTM
jgi:hypothetical protein